MARAIWPRRWGVNLSVLRRSWPKFENQELVRSWFETQRHVLQKSTVPIPTPDERETY